MLQATDIVIRLNPADDVVIARVEIPAGTMLLRENARVAVKVAPGHKIAARDVKPGAPVRRYNQIIGFATRDIKAGDHVHVLRTASGEKSKSELWGYGEDEFAPWTLGATM